MGERGEVGSTWFWLLKISKPQASGNERAGTFRVCTDGIECVGIDGWGHDRAAGRGIDPPCSIVADPLGGERSPGNTERDDRRASCSWISRIQVKAPERRCVQGVEHDFALRRCMDPKLAGNLFQHRSLANVRKSKGEYHQYRRQNERLAIPDPMAHFVSSPRLLQRTFHQRSMGRPSSVPPQGRPIIRVAAFVGGIKSGFESDGSCLVEVLHHIHA